MKLANRSTQLPEFSTFVFLSSSSSPCSALAKACLNTSCFSPSRKVYVTKLMTCSARNCQVVIRVYLVNNVICQVKSFVGRYSNNRIGYPARPRIGAFPR
jgi:hypothetical protein